MTEFAKAVLLESIENGDIGAIQRLLQQMKERGLEIVVKEVENN